MCLDVLLHAWDNFIEVKHAQPEEVQELLSKLVQDVKIISDELSEYIITLAWNRPSSTVLDDDDEDYTIAITPVLSTEEPVNSLIMEDEHLDTIPVTESDEFIKSSVKILVPIPSESKGVPKIPSLKVEQNVVEYVEASPPDSEPVSSGVMEIVIPEVGGLRMEILLIKTITLREKIVECHRLVAKIEALNDNSRFHFVVVTKSTSTFPNLFLEETNTFDNSLPESETFCFNLEELSSGSPTTHSELSLPDYKVFYIDNDHFKEKSSGSTTTHVDFYHMISFIFDLSNDQFTPTIGDCPDCEDSCIVIHLRVLTSSASFGNPIHILSTNVLSFWHYLINGLGLRSRSGYQQKDRKPSQNDKTEHGMEKYVQNQGKVQKMSKSSKYEESLVSKPERKLKNTIDGNLYPSDGPGKPPI
ncbi:hypothetical protein Tco_1072454 [Tanacetum coccineum]